MQAIDDVARTVLEARYLRRDDEGALEETPSELFERVARNLASVEDRLGGDVDQARTAFLDAMASSDLLPNSPTLMNAGTSLQQLAACFVLPVEDGLDAIFSTLRHAALIHKSGGGTGFSFSQLRASGDVVQGTGGVASGPVSFMRVFDAATEEIKQGGRRRGANMGVLEVSHPDIHTFIQAKRDEQALRNFNISVATRDGFWKALEQGEMIDLVNPRDGATWGQADPDALLDEIAELAWATGDPGLIFLDRINETQPTPALGEITATNPCGEIPLLPYEACVLGSVNLARMSHEGTLDRDRLARTVRVGVRLLDDAIEASTFPLPEIDRMMQANRKIGLGVMGLHDLLIDLGIAYDSDKAVTFCEELMAFVQAQAVEASRDLAAERGAFPNWEQSRIDEPQRNATVTAIAPTGTISLIAGCSASIEPIYNVAYTKRVLGGLPIVNQRFVEIARREGFYSDELLERIQRSSSIEGFDEIPEHVRELFKTAHSIPAQRHLEMQAAFQAHVDNAVSKTVNLANSASPADVRAIYERAHELGLKGVTVFRSGSKRAQVLGTDPLKEECVSECDYVGPA